MLRASTFVLPVVVIAALQVVPRAQVRPAGPPPSQAAAGPAAGGDAAAALADYVIGPDDQLSIVFWREKEMSVDVAVRPDGKISLPLLNDVHAAGLTPPQLRERLTEDAKRFIEDPNVTVVVRQINSRRVFVTGEVARPGPYPLTGPTTVLQMLATAGGLREYADQKNILILRPANGHTDTYRFNYKDVSKRRNLVQNVELRPGDTIVVP